MQSLRVNFKDRFHKKVIQISQSMILVERICKSFILVFKQQVDIFLVQNDSRTTRQNNFRDDKKILGSYNAIMLLITFLSNFMIFLSRDMIPFSHDIHKKGKNNVFTDHLEKHIRKRNVV